MTTHLEKIINNCLQHIPFTEPFNCWFILNSLGENAYGNMQFPSLNSQSDTTQKNAILMSNYLLVKKFAEKTEDNQLLLTTEGRRLKKVGEIHKYECREWWKRNWPWIINIAGLAIGIITLILKFKASP